jgi:hypothetical protein
MMDFLRYSGIWFGFVVNPYHWRIKIESPTDEFDHSALHGIAIYLGPFWFRFIIDDGTR